MESEKPFSDFILQPERSLRLSHRPRRIENVKIDSAFFWTMMVIVLICIGCITCCVILKLISNRRSIRRKLRSYGIVIGEASVANVKENNIDIQSERKKILRTRIHSAQAPRRRIRNSHRARRDSRRSRQSRQSRYNNLPAYGNYSPNVLTPIQRNSRQRATGSRASPRFSSSPKSNRSRKSALPILNPSQPCDLSYLPMINLRHNNYLI
ncbi:unnamed protein product [Moneuplotes crassus]|uniref:Uncharacterized protein n=1 Tax=Euplotes crassus TaxID=5936 RepID=A0AAD1XYF6_EUPCR|nr:unnamed protein product [Moneuplotes crassus]